MIEVNEDYSFFTLSLSNLSPVLSVQIWLWLKLTSQCKCFYTGTLLTRHSVLILISLANKKKGLSRFIFHPLCEKKKKRKISCSAPHTEKVAIQTSAKIFQRHLDKAQISQAYSLLFKIWHAITFTAQAFLKTRRIKYLFLETNIFDPSVVELFL